jgi:hypothetical protein
MVEVLSWWPDVEWLQRGWYGDRQPEGGLYGAASFIAEIWYWLLCFAIGYLLFRRARRMFKQVPSPSSAVGR